MLKFPPWRKEVRERKGEDRVILKTFVIQGKTGFSGAISGISVTSGGWNGEIIPMKWCSTGGERKLRVSVAGSLIRQMNRDASERALLARTGSFQMTLRSFQHMNEAKVLGKRQNRIESGSIRKSIMKFQGRKRERNRKNYDIQKYQCI